MPSSPLKWNSIAKREMPDVIGLNYGVKRRNDEGDEPSLDDCLTMSLETQSKRLCVWPTLPDRNTLQQQEEEMAAHTQEGQLLPTQQQQFGQPLEVHIDNNNTQHLISPSQNQQPVGFVNNSNIDMVMNINADDGCAMESMDDESAMESYSAAYDAMDGEGAVDSSQYGSRRTTGHEQHCFGIEQSPNSGRVRCHCVPAWDTMMDSKAFFSDIY